MRNVTDGKRSKMAKNSSPGEVGTKGDNSGDPTVSISSSISPSSSFSS
jgi:hypothetical protein